MTRASLREYAGVQRERYLRAPRAEKHRLLNEVVAVSGLHRKAAIRLLRRPLSPPTSRPRSGRPRRYGPAVAAAAQLIPTLCELPDRSSQHQIESGRAGRSTSVHADGELLLFVAPVTRRPQGR